MTQYLDNIPPVLKLALDASLHRHRTVESFCEELKTSGLEEEFKRQALWTITNYEYTPKRHVPETSLGFTVSASGSLNPFSATGKCSDMACRFQAIKHFITTIGLYSDGTLLADPVTGFFLTDKEISYRRLFASLNSLAHMVPLIREGLITFVSPTMALCQHCLDEVQRKITSITVNLAQQCGTRASIRLVDGSEAKAFTDRYGGDAPFLLVQTPDLDADHSHPLLVSVPLNHPTLTPLKESLAANPKRNRRRILNVHKDLIVASAIQGDVRTTFFELDSARRLNSLFLAASRLESLLIANVESGAPVIADIEEWEAVRSVALPWISELNADQIVQLRNEASHALPRLRQTLATSLSSSSGSQNITGVLQDLRAQALDVEMELRALGVRKEQRFRAGMAGLSMAFIVYGFASGLAPVAATSLATFLATLAHLRSTERDLSSKHEKLISSPGYALLKAKQIRKNTQPQPGTMRTNQCST